MLHLAGCLIFFIKSLEGDVQLIRNHLCDPIGITVIPAEHPTHVSNHRLRSQCSESNDLSNRPFTIFMTNIIDHFRPTIRTEIDVDIGRTHPFRIEKSLEQQLEFQRIDIRNPHRISNHRPGCRSTAWPHRDIPFLGPVNEIPNDQKVIHEPLLLKHADFQRIPLLHLLRFSMRSVAFNHPCLHDIA